MPFAIFQNENVANAIAPSGAWQQGISNKDLSTLVEQNAKLPWPSDALPSYVYYSCLIECRLDSGLVVHRQLPQYSPAVADSLGVVDCYDDGMIELKSKGVNTVSFDRYTDTVQRMAHSLYRFVLRGEALRVGEQIPIPKLVSIAGVAAVPDDVINQMGYNVIRGNYMGVPLYYANWILWYTIAAPPKKNVVPPTNLAAHIRGDQQLPGTLQAPWSQPDDDAEKAQPVLQNPI